MRLWLSIIEIGHLKEINIPYLNNEITAADEINTLRKFFIFGKDFLKKFLSCSIKITWIKAYLD